MDSNARIADIESPYDGPDDATIRRNILYARLACAWALRNGYCPYASHLFFTQPGLLDDKVPAERTLGIEAGKRIALEAATVSLFFLDLGESSGMAYGRKLAQKAGRLIHDIRLFDTNTNITSITYEGLLELAREHGHISGPYERMGW